MTEPKKVQKPILWSDDFAIGIEVIDMQHKNLLNMVSEAYASLSESSTPMTLQRITKELLSYAIYHFETEESLMQEYHYDVEHPNDADAHKQEHRQFSAKVVAARKEMKQGDIQQVEAILDFLQTWIASHTQETDRRLGRFLSQKME
ncbi:MAG: bacteriohemerythrin [Candidatus Thiodiazotropha sp. (ex. Lucinoma kazani)]